MNHGRHLGAGFSPISTGSGCAGWRVSPLGLDSSLACSISIRRKHPMGCDKEKRLHVNSVKSKIENKNFSSKENYLLRSLEIFRKEEYFCCLPLNKPSSS